jgi:hypothetical protein
MPQDLSGETEVNYGRRQSEYPVSGLSYNKAYVEYRPEDLLLGASYSVIVAGIEPLTAGC